MVPPKRRNLISITAKTSCTKLLGNKAFDHLQNDSRRPVRNGDLEFHDFTQSHRPKIHFKRIVSLPALFHDLNTALKEFGKF